MAEFISFQPSDYFNSKLYTGTGSSNAITGVGFQPDATWIKGRNTTYNHVFTDSVRGVTEEIYPNTSGGEVTNAQGLTAFGADGFTVGTDAGYNGNTNTYASWNWKMGTTSGITQGGASITPTGYSFDSTAKQSVIKYTGTGSVATVPHGLGVKPDLILFKNLDAANEYWAVYHKDLGATKRLYLNATNTAATDAVFMNDTEPTADVFTIGTEAKVNGNGESMVAYCFAGRKGYSKFGSYIANNDADGPFVYTGFRPSMVFMKNYVNGAWSWQLLDCRREGYNSSNDQLYPNTTAVEGSDGYGDLMATGFKITAANSGINDSGATFIYAAFAEFPTVSSNDMPGVAR